MDAAAGAHDRDVVVGGDGNDVIRARDGSRDTISCGRGNDRVYADRLDKVADDCESVTRR